MFKVFNVYLLFLDRFRYSAAALFTLTLSHTLTLFLSINYRTKRFPSQKLPLFYYQFSESTFQCIFFHKNAYRRRKEEKQN